MSTSASACVLGGSAEPPVPTGHGPERHAAPHEQRPVLGREPALDDHAAVVVDPGREVGAKMERLGFIGGDATVGPYGPLQLRGCEAAREPEQLFLRVGVGDARDRAHLRVRELAASERGVDARQLGKAPGHAYVLARRPGEQRTPPREPRGARAAAVVLPVAALVELADELEEAAGTRGEVRRKRRELVLQLPNGHVLCCHVSQQRKRYRSLRTDRAIPS